MLLSFLDFLLAGSASDPGAAVKAAPQAHISSGEWMGIRAVVDLPNILCV